MKKPVIELENIENDYIKKLESGETAEVLTIFNDEFIPCIH